jgi:hypothetical protein
VMRKKMVGIGTIGIVGLLVVGAVAMWAFPDNAEAAYGGRRALTGAGPTGFRGTVRQPASPDPVDPVITGRDVSPTALSESEMEAVMAALNDEYKAWSIYDEVISDLGAARPFVNIQRAEENHITALVGLLDRYGIDVPPNEWPGGVPTFDSLGEACAAGVQAEIENADLYDGLLKMVDDPEVIRVFTALQQASLTKHLPAFERCAP